MDARDSAYVLGQRQMLATLALAVALLSFLNLAGMEKAVLAIVLGVKALRVDPHPPLVRRRSWAKVGIGLGATHLVLVVTIILLNLDRLGRLLDALRAMSDLR